MNNLDKINQDLNNGEISIAFNEEVKIHSIVNQGIGRIIGMDGAIVNETIFDGPSPTAQHFLTAFLLMHMYNNEIHKALNATK